MEIGPVRRVTRRVVVGLSVVCLLAAVSSSECEGQLLRRHWAKQWDHVPPQYNQPLVEQVPAYGGPDLQGSPVSQVFNQAPAARLPKWPFSQSRGNGYDPRIHPDADAWSRYPKFIGGFHSSHFTNVGLPNGDIGFRGNGLYWAPW